MSDYEDIRRGLRELSDKETDKEKSAFLLDASYRINAAHCLLSATTRAARNMGYEGEDYEGAFYFLQERGAEVLAATRANEEVVFVNSVIGDLETLAEKIRSRKNVR